jgi:hypothetical protein
MTKTVVVRDRYRTNELSLIPGGHRVTVLHKKGASRVYENVKNPNIYCQSIIKNTNVVEIHVDEEPFWKRSGE